MSLDMNILQGPMTKVMDVDLGVNSGSILGIKFPYKILRTTKSHRTIVIPTKLGSYT